MDRFFAPPEGRLFACFPGAEERPGQARMAELVFDAIGEGSARRKAWRDEGADPETKPDAVVQAIEAGTGTGKSLGYLVPAMLHDKRVVVATATLALQHQLVERDLPRLVEAVKDVPGIDTSYAVLKGRSNYACLHRIREGVPDDQGALVEV